MYNHTYQNDYYPTELYHYGVKGMKWGVRRANRFTNKARIARQSAKEWEEIGANKSAKLRAKGKLDKAAKVETKYKSAAAQDRSDAKTYEQRAKGELAKQKHRDARAAVGKSRSFGAKAATFVLGGPFANRTYNSVIASGGSQYKAIGVTAATSILGGPIGNLAVSAVYTSSAGERAIRK